MCELRRGRRSGSRERLLIEDDCCRVSSSGHLMIRLEDRGQIHTLCPETGVCEITRLGLGLAHLQLCLLKVLLLLPLALGTGSHLCDECTFYSLKAGLIALSLYLTSRGRSSPAALKHACA